MAMKKLAERRAAALQNYEKLPKRSAFLIRKGSQRRNLEGTRSESLVKAMQGEKSREAMSKSDLEQMKITAEARATPEGNLVYPKEKKKK